MKRMIPVYFPETSINNIFNNRRFIYYFIGSFTVLLEVAYKFFVVLQLSNFHGTFKSIIKFINTMTCHLLHSF